MLLPLGAMGRPTWRPVLRIFVLISLLSNTSFAATPVTGFSAGVNTRTGERPFRRNLQNFQSSGAAFDLYIQALQKFQSDDQGDMFSYYQISGIHGLPYKAWDGVTGSQQNGYCEHGSIIFPPWHRPYLALFEQRLCEYAENIADTYPPNSRRAYQDAADSLRIPYWDWASNASLPNCLVTPQISITTPSGRKQIDNPLYTYKFHPPEAGKDFPSGAQIYQYPDTVRSPDSKGNSQNNVVQSLMQANAASIQSGVYQLLTSETNYSVFATDSLPDRGASYNNLESIHNNIHGITGNGGHMTYLEVSAFDPIFWLHHCNVDRILALWQVINPNSYVQPESNNYGTFVINPGTVEDVNTPLYPFHASADASNFWTSETARGTREFGYTYPEIVDWNVDQQTLISNVKTAVNKLYNPVSASKRSKLPTGFVERGFQNSSKVINGKLDRDEFLKLGVNNLNKQYVINIVCDRDGVNNPFGIHFFYGPAPANAAESSNAANLIGTFYIIPAPFRNASRPSYNQLPLSPLLASGLNSNVINSLDEDVIIPLLTAKLSWTITDMSGNELNIQEAVDKGGLTITIVARDVQPLQKGQEDTFPKYSEWTQYDEPTQGKPGG
ncbi:hypothetical protein Egran_00294, partial [Elaphomyces granulatus]